MSPASTTRINERKVVGRAGIEIEVPLEKDRDAWYQLGVVTNGTKLSWFGKDRGTVPVGLSLLNMRNTFHERRSTNTKARDILF